MNSKRKWIILVITAAVAACAGPQEKPKNPPAASEVTPTSTTSAEKPASKPEEKPRDSIVITPLDEPAASPSSSEPVSAAETGSSSEMKMTEETQSPPAPGAKPATPPAMVKAIPSKRMTVIADRVPREFTITVETKNPSHPNYGLGHDIGFVVDGVQGKELVLTRGVTYIFHVRTNIQHDFYFTTSPRGRGAGTVTDGIRGQFTYKGDVTFTPGASTPDVMYYECRNHPFMGGKIHIANAGDKVTVGGEVREATKKNEEERVVTSAQVKQKLSFAEMVLGSSPTIKRVAASNNTEAKNLLAQAKQQVDNARSSLSTGDNAAAMDAVNESLRMVSEAGRLVPSEAGQDYKAHYSELMDQLRGFEKSYQKNLDRGLKPKSGKELDKAKYDRLLKEADGFAGKGEYEDGVKRLETANRMLTEALGALLESQTVVYDKNFKTPQEEYEYELSRYGSYEELIPVAKEQRKPTEQTVAMMDQLAARAKEIHDEGVALAEKGNHKMAIMALQAATERLQQALRLAGVQ